MDLYRYQSRCLPNHKEYLQDYPEVKLCKISTPYPFPEKFVLSCLEGVDEVICLEELSPFIEAEVTKLIGKHRLNIKVYGKENGYVKTSGENSADYVAKVLSDFLKIPSQETGIYLGDMPDLPVRPPVLCAGCPHRASFYAVKKAMEGKNAYFCGDIGCYT